MSKLSIKRDSGVTRECCEQVASNWTKIVCYFVTFYSLLAIFFEIHIFIYFFAFDWKRPRLQNIESLLKGNPGMGFRPRSDDTLVHINVNDRSANAHLLRNVLDFLTPYQQANLANDSQYADCNATHGATAEDMVCQFSLDSFGDSCSATNNFGMAHGQPCILLKLNKIYGWVPEPMSQSQQQAYGSIGCNVRNSTKPQIPCSLPDLNAEFIPVTCEGETSADRDNMGPIEFRPSGGFARFYYPYTNQPGYLAPLVVVRFTNPRRGVLLMIWCRAWAGNIYHDRYDLAGSVHFELLVDS